MSHAVAPSPVGAAPFPVGTIVLDANDLERIVIGVKPDGRVMTVGAPDLPWVRRGCVEVAPPARLRPRPPSLAACPIELRPSH